MKSYDLTMVGRRSAARPGPPLGARSTAVALVALVSSLLVGCGCSRTEKRGEQPRDGTLQAESDKPARVEVPATIELGPIRKGSLREHRLGHAWLFEKGAQPRKINIGEAEATGHTVIDLSDDWVPYIFSEKTPGSQDAQENIYRQRYVDLANDRVDSDGDPLSDHEHNYLELYGIPPTLTVLDAEWTEGESHVTSCLEQAAFDYELFERFRGVVAFKSAGNSKERKAARWYKAKLDKTMRKAKLEPGAYAAAAEHPKTKSLYTRWRKAQDPIDVIDHAQRRFRCERLYNADGGLGTYKSGQFDSQTTHALAAFEKKNGIMGWGHFTTESAQVLAQTPAQATHARLLRALRDRVVSAAGVVEDGSAAQWKPDFRWKDVAGEEHALRDVGGEMTEATIAALDLETPERARASLHRLRELGEDGFAGLLVAIKLPELPGYYGEDMEFDALIDRGDVWYEFPYDDEGNKKHQRRRRYPHMTLYVTYQDQRIPLVHWRTTIGSWRAEHVEGQQYFKYKNSDVGARVWKDIMAAPAWIPPPSTPPDEIIKRKYIGRRWQTVVNYDETGPGYRSAYGLVAAYHIKQVKNEDGSIRAELDNQIRTHGSVDYMSIQRRFSHGCHRLYNVNAVRMFSMILRHSEYTRHGQQHVGYRRRFEHEGEQYKIALDTRGYKYELQRPIPVMVTKGRIKGRQRRPIEDFLPMPGQEYTEDGETSGEGDMMQEMEGMTTVSPPPPPAAQLPF